MNFTKTLKKVTLLILSVLLIFTSILSQGQIPEELKGILSESLDELQNQYKFKGLSVAVSYPRQGTWTAARGVSAPGVDLQVDEMISIGSSTKTFISTTILLLEQDGLLSIKDTIGIWIKGYDHISGDITIEQLLNHTSGLYSYTENEIFLSEVLKNVNREWTDDEILRTFLKPALFSPGNDLEYSNTGYIIAGMIIKEVTGEPWYSVVRERIINPLQLKQTFIPPYENVDGKTANIWTMLFGSELTNAGNGKEDDLLPFNINTLASASGAIISTPADNALFYKYLLSGNIIKKSTLRDKMMNFMVSGGTGYGLGLFKYASPAGGDLFAHEGAAFGQVCTNLSDTSYGISLSVLSNQDSLGIAELDQVAITLYLRTLNFYRQNANIVEAPKPELSHRIYPNPVLTDFVNIELDNKQDLQVIDVINTSGKVVKSIARSNMYSDTLRLNVSLWSPDLYIIRYTSNSGVKTYSKMIIQEF